MTSTALAVAGVGWAQEQPPAGDSDGSDKVVIVGSQIVGARPTDALPVTVIGEEELDAIGASSGDELFRSIPQLGDVGFNSASGVNNVGGVNAARGDTASINLRALGTGNTLVLLNGRRMVNHPGTQAENLVPVVTVNANAIPTSGVSRIEVLLDGASALYGADAVAGVLNTVLKDNIEGFLLDLTYGSEDGASADDFAASWELGVKSDDGATRLSLLGSYFTRDPVFAGDRDFSANADLRSRLPADWAANTTVAGQFDNRTATTAWAGFDRFSTGNITVGGVPVTDTFGRFHTQPNTLPGCRVQLGNGVCIDNNLWTLPPADPVSAQFPTGQIADVTNGSTRDGALRYNTNAATTVSNGVDRYNLFAFFNQDLGESLELFAEAGVYLADSVGYREQTAMLAAVPIVIPASNYWNPFGPVGSPNRLANTNAPAQGLDISLTAYRPIDAGPRKTQVENLTTRVLAGLRGDVAGWDWESALLYSQATTEDRENRVSNTLFQQALALATPDAYNPFNGGCVNDVSAGDCTPNPPGVISSFVVPSFRRSGTSLATWDVKVSRPDLFTLWAGDVGAAFGIEATIAIRDRMGPSCSTISSARVH
jgi:outer membrane receptor protein involved in Fe transport